MLKKLFPFFLIAAVAIAAYSNSFDVPFQFDGKEYIAKNPYLKDLKLVPQLWFKDGSHKARYLTHLSFAVNYYYHGLDVFGYHVFNLSVHILNAFLIWWFLQLIFTSPKGSELSIARHRNLIGLCAALLFVAHPLQTQAVTYITQRFASLATMFYLLSMCFYAKARVSGKVIFYLCCAFAALAGMFTKQITLTIPVMILLYEFTFVSGLKIEKRKLTLLIALILVFACIIPTLYSFKMSILNMSVRSGSHYGDYLIPGTYLLTQFRVILTYIRLLFFPINQNLDYDFVMSQSFFEPKTLLSFLTLLILFIGACLLFKRNRVIAFGILWMFVTLSVESTIIVIRNVIFEHRAYLPSIGFFIVLSCSMAYLIKDKRVFIGVLTVLTIMLAALTFNRNKVWQSEIALWSDALEKSPGKARPYKNLGIAYAQEGSLQRALAYLLKAHQMEPDDIDTINNLGNVYYRLGQVQKAIEMYEKTLQIDPDHAAAHNNLGSVYYDHGNLDQAAVHYEKSRKSDPFNAKVYYNLANIYYKKGDKDRALWMNQQAIGFAPNFADAHQNMGVLMSDMNKDDEAIGYYKKVLQIDPNYAKAHNNLAAIYFKRKKYSLAIAHLDYAVKTGYKPNPMFLKALEPYR